MRSILLCAAFAGLLSSDCTGIAQQSCRSTVFVTALDQKTNQPIDGLTAGDFHAKLKGDELLIRAIAPPPKNRRFVVVLDRSGSMTGSPDFPIPKPDRQRYDPNLLAPLALRDALSVISKGDLVAFLEFAGLHSRQTEFVEPKTALQRLPEILAWSPAGKGPPKGRTPLWDNIDAAMRMLSPHQTGDSIVVVSDGGDNLSRLREGQVQNELLNAGVAILAFEVASPMGAMAQKEDGARNLLGLANATGGAGTAHGFIRRGQDLELALPVRPSQLILQLAHQYGLELETPVHQNQEKWRLGIASSRSEGKVKLLYPHFLSVCPPAP
jgi:hypothetical protein